MSKDLSEALQSLRKEILGNRFLYILLFVVLLGGFVIRVWRIDQVMGFYFDQGRDAKVIWDFWHKGMLFLVGPTTGIAGIFRGPFYYYLIAPFYLLGGGDPVWPSVFLSFTTVAAIGILYYFGYLLGGRMTGLIAAIIGSFSFHLVLASRWLSNPTPMFLLSVVLIWFMYLVMQGKRWAWVGISFVSGLSLFHFGSAGEIFYFPALAIFLVWQRKNWPDRKIFLWSGVVFFATAIPQILFDIRHSGILRGNIANFLLKEETFESSFNEVVSERLNFYYHVFTSKLFDYRSTGEKKVMAVVAVIFLLKFPKFWKDDKFKALLLVFVAPLIGLLFFQGNQGNIYDYYLTGYYLLFVLLFALGLGSIWKYKLGKLFVIYFFWVFATQNYPLLKSRFSDGLDGPHSISLGNEKLAVEWVYEDAAGRKFNVDTYVPPVIPHSYDYLYMWIGDTKFNERPQKELVSLLYTIYEQDPPHPERLEEWHLRQSGIGIIEEEISFGGITVQRRTRIGD